MARREFLLCAAAAAFLPFQKSHASSSVPGSTVAVHLAPPSATIEIPAYSAAVFEVA